MEPLLDYKAEPIDIGDEFIIASPRRFGDCSYSRMIVTGRTEKMLRAVKCPFQTAKNLQSAQKKDIEDHWKDYRQQFAGTPREQGALIPPWNTYKIGPSPLFTPEEIKDLFKKTKDEDNAETEETWDSNWAVPAFP